MEDNETALPTWIDRHSVNCLICNALVDERDCIHGEDGEGSICPACVPKEPNDD